MSWSRGSELFEEFINILKEQVLDENIRIEIYKQLIPVFEDLDCDTLDECIGKDDIFDEVYKDINPEYFDAELTELEDIWEEE